MPPSLSPHLMKKWWFYLRQRSQKHYRHRRHSTPIITRLPAHDMLERRCRYSYDAGHSWDEWLLPYRWHWCTYAMIERIGTPRISRTKQQRRRAAALYFSLPPLSHHYRRTGSKFILMMITICFAPCHVPMLYFHLHYIWCRFSAAAVYLGCFDWYATLYFDAQTLHIAELYLWLMRRHAFI